MKMINGFISIFKVSCLDRRLTHTVAPKNSPVSVQSQVQQSDFHPPKRLLEEKKEAEREHRAAIQGLEVMVGAAAGRRSVCTEGPQSRREG